LAAEPLNVQWKADEAALEKCFELGLKTGETAHSIC